MDDCCKDNKCGEGKAEHGQGGCENCQCKPVQAVAEEEAACCGGGCCG